MQTFESGDSVLIKAGPFANFTGIVQTVDTATSILLVAVEIFGRVADVEVPLTDAEKLGPEC
jgi:transcriptional antiterminator NusG